MTHIVDSIMTHEDALRLARQMAEATGRDVAISSTSYGEFSLHLAHVGGDSEEYEIVKPRRAVEIDY